MGPEFVVVAEPVVGGLLHLADGVEQPGVEHFLAKAAVEALDEGVLVGLAGLDEQQLDLVLLVSYQQHDAKRRGLRASHMGAIRDVRAARERDRPTGLAAFLGRVSGVELVRKVLHRYEDGKRLRVYRAERAELKTQQERAARNLETHLGLHARDIARKPAALDKVDQREHAAFMRDQRTEQRIRDRDGDDRLPSLEELQSDGQASTLDHPALQDVFLHARDHDQTLAIPDVLSAFRRATRASEDRYSGDGTRSKDRSLDDGESPTPGRDGDRTR